MRILTSVFCLLITGLLHFNSWTQDTITVQTFTYDSITTRRAIFSFPPELQSIEFEKVLMYYNLKCDPLTTWDSYNCGEWDYLVYSQIWNHTGTFDSVEVNKSKYFVNISLNLIIEMNSEPLKIIFGYVLIFKVLFILSILVNPTSKD